MGVTIEFVHLHLYRAGPRFRTHVGIRPWDDPFEAIALNGPASRPTDPYHMVFTDNEASIEACVDAITRYCQTPQAYLWPRSLAETQGCRTGTSKGRPSQTCGDSLVSRSRNR